MSDPQDNFLRNKSAMEQCGRALEEFAHPLKKYHDALIVEGFNTDQAFRLVLEMQKHIITGSIEEKNERR